MSEIKHTPGPWTYLAGTTTCEKVLGADWKVVADGWWCRSVEEVDANSHLIAAAPELFEALQTVLKIIERHMGTSTAAVEGTPIFKARAAIAKATGEKS